MVSFTKTVLQTQPLKLPGEVKCYVEQDGNIVREQGNNFIYWRLVHNKTKYDRCCNCGQRVPSEHSGVAYHPYDYYAICNEGCAIDLIQRGECAAGNHPWKLGLTLAECEREYPELKRIRDLIRLSNPDVSFD